MSLGFLRTAPAQDAQPQAIDAPNVVRNYSGAAPCNTTLQACLSISANGDAINVVAGTHVTTQCDFQLRGHPLRN